MKYYIHFDTSMRNNFEYWIPLFNRFKNVANIIKIYVWKTEKNILDLIKELDNEIVTIDKEDNPLMTCFVIELTKNSYQYLLVNGFDDNNLSKYFGFSLWHDNVELVSSEHYGNECTICNLTYEDIEEFKKLIPPNSSVIIHNEEGIIYKQKA